MRFTVHLLDHTLDVEADEHRIEGCWHVFRRTAIVMGQPRTIVALRLPARDVRSVRS